MFRKGQKLVYVDDFGDWEFGNVGTSPEIGEVVTYVGESPFVGHILIQEYLHDFDGARQAFKAWRFKPLIGNSCIDELVTKEEVKETSDLTIKVPEYES